MRESDVSYACRGSAYDVWCATLTLLLQWVLRGLALRHVDYTVHVEADLLRVGRPVFVAEAVFVLAVVSCDERVVARADGALVNLECVGGVLDL